MTVEQLFRSRAGHLLRHAILLRSQCFQKHVLCIVVSEAHNIVHTACQPHYRLDAFRLAWGLLETCDDRKEVLAIRLFAIHTTLNGPNTISWDHSNASLSSWITWSRYADIRSLGFFGRSHRSFMILSRCHLETVVSWLRHQASMGCGLHSRIDLRVIYMDVDFMSRPFEQLVSLAQWLKYYSMAVGPFQSRQRRFGRRYLGSTKSLWTSITKATCAISITLGVY